MKKCPFCDSEPEIVSKYKRLSSKKESEAQNITLVQKHYNREGKFQYNEYKQEYYIIRCSDKNCLAYHLNKSFFNIEEARAAWNIRDGE